MKATRNFVFFVVLSIFSAAESSSLLKFKARQEDANINKLMAILDQPTMLERDQPIDFFWKWVSLNLISMMNINAYIIVRRVVIN